MLTQKYRSNEANITIQKNRQSHKAKSPNPIQQKAPLRQRIIEYVQRIIEVRYIQDFDAITKQLAHAYREEYFLYQFDQLATEQKFCRLWRECYVKANNMVEKQENSSLPGIYLLLQDNVQSQSQLFNFIGQKYIQKSTKRSFLDVRRVILNDRSNCAFYEIQDSSVDSSVDKSV